MLYSIALSGFCLLLDLHFLAAVQLTVNLYLAGIILTTGKPERSATALDITALLRPGRVLGYVAGGVLFVGLAWLLAATSQTMARGMLGEPTFNSLPMWAARGDHVSALGQELVTRHSVLLILLGLLILASIVSVAHMRRSRYRPGKREQ